MISVSVSEFYRPCLYFWCFRRFLFVFPFQEKKGERIQEKRGEQKEFMKSVVQRVLGEFITAGRLGKTELDEAAQAVLEKMEAKVRGGGGSCT